MNILYRIEYWINEHAPVRCAGCGAWLLAKNSHTLTLRWGKTVSACQECYDLEMNPWTAKK